MKMSNKSISIAFIGILIVIAIISFIGILLMEQKSIILQGEIEATEIQISGKLPGRIEKFNVQEGDWVESGDTLVIINSPIVEAQYKQANALKRVAQEEQKKIDTGTRKQIIATAKQLWNKTLSDLTLAQTTYQRIERLYNDSIATSQQKDEAEAIYKAALAAERAAYEQYQLAIDGPQNEDKAAAQNIVEAAHSTVEEVSALLMDAHLTAPSKGQIGSIYPKQGELVAPGAPIMSLIIMEDIHLVLNVREDLMPHFKNGETIHVDIPAINGKGVGFRIYYISPLGSFATWKSTQQAGSYDMRTFEIHARPLTHIPELRPGMSILLAIK